MPVLSEQITEALPNVSTAGRRRIMAFFFTILVTPSERTTVTIAGRPSGIADTARDTAVMNISITSIPAISPTMNTTTQAARATIPRYLPNLDSFFCSGVLVSFSPAKSPAILPICVFIPVPVTTAVAVPLVTEQPEKMQLSLSPNGASSFTSASASLSAGTDSPVSADSSLFRFALTISLASAGTKSPASSLMMSPGTTCVEATMLSCPFLITLACGADIFFSASSAFSALLSCTNPSTAFKMTMSRMSAGSMNSMGSPSTHATTKEMTAARMRMIIITSLNCSKNRRAKLFFFFSSSLFSPNSARRAAASSEFSPSSASVFKSCSASCALFP